MCFIGSKVCTFIADVESCVVVGLISDELDPYSRTFADYALEGYLSTPTRVEQHHGAGVQATPQHKPTGTQQFVTVRVETVRSFSWTHKTCSGLKVGGRDLTTGHMNNKCVDVEKLHRRADWFYNLGNQNKSDPLPTCEGMTVCFSSIFCLNTVQH